MPRTTLRDLADRVIEGGLDAWLKDQRTSGTSILDITLRLRDEHNIHVSPETVRRWLPSEPEAA